LPLVAGSAGGSPNSPGPSGGALQISAGLSLTITNTGAINVGGSGGSGGGGSGGAILLEAPTITVDGILVSNGGGGGNTENLGGGGQNASPSSGVPAPGATAGNGAGGGGAGGAGATTSGVSGTAYDGGVSTTNGGGGGGVGWIRINSTCPVIGTTAIISPSLSPATTCATQGPLP
jgi:hypothetical protein